MCVRLEHSNASLTHFYHSYNLLTLDIVTEFDPRSFINVVLWTHSEQQTCSNFVAVRMCTHVRIVPNKEYVQFYIEDLFATSFIICQHNCPNICWDSTILSL